VIFRGKKMYENLATLAKDLGNGTNLLTVLPVIAGDRFEDVRNDFDALESILRISFGRNLQTKLSSGQKLMYK
jgi:hypothetical protein